MNKFQKIAYQIAKDDSKKELYKDQNIKKRYRRCYTFFNEDREVWNYRKCIEFKNWGKGKWF
ncbi:MAG: hypothetical protein DBY38_12725 [Clostridium cadaveris]|uniref:Uncharacterized protein n=1 Tax=Clostridium cadaveris TaxID=1529 RepID=A0A316M5L1_9CLOT|nr:MAG: hypothetical protein DBY38_12725 [Clostridium cadaveris]